MAAKSKSIFRSHLKPSSYSPNDETFLCEDAEACEKVIGGAEFAASAISDLWRGTANPKTLELKVISTIKAFPLGEQAQIRR